MKYVLRFAFFTMLLACVPASEKRAPAGAAGFVTEPSAAARGEPFTTDDGWTLRFEKVIVQADVSAYPSASSEGGFGSGERWLFDASKRAVIFARELPLGPCGVEPRLAGSYISRDYENYFEDVVNLGVSRVDEARFRRLPDVGADQSEYGGPGANLVVAVRAEKDGRGIMFDLALSVLSQFDSEKRVPLEVRADALDVAPLGVEPERLFIDEEDGSVRFGPIADADANGDGHVTGAELAELDAAPQKVPAKVDGPVTFTPHSPTYELLRRGARILVPR